MKCYVNTIAGTGTKEITKTITSTVHSNTLITLMLATHLSSKMKQISTKFKAATQNCNVYKIIGNGVSSGGLPSELQWVPLHRHGGDKNHTVVVIDLESIYPGRDKIMRSIYQCDSA